MPGKPTDLRSYRKRTERNLVIGAALLFVVVGSILVGLIYDWGAALTALLCLLPGAGALVALWLLMAGLEHFTKE